MSWMHLVPNSYLTSSFSSIDHQHMRLGEMHKVSLPGNCSRSGFIKLKCNHKNIYITGQQNSPPINSARKPLMRVKEKEKANIFEKTRRQLRRSSPPKKQKKERKPLSSSPSNPNPFRPTSPERKPNQVGWPCSEQSVLPLCCSCRRVPS
jgi:hypothetical protein